MQRYNVGALAALIALMTSPALGQDTDARIRLLETTLEDLLERDAEKDRIIRELREQVDELKAGHRGDLGEVASDRHDPSDERHGHDAHDQAEADHAHEGEGPAPDLYSLDVGGGRLRLKGIAVDTALAAGGSSESGEALQQLEGGDHDPRQNGFTVQTVDFSFLGGFEPYFDAETHLAVFLDTEGETVLEFEEAFLRTRNLPGGLELEAGQMFTEFGRINPRHFHDRDWLDQPVIATRLFGPDGMRAPGIRFGWDLPVPTSTTLHLGAQNARGETMQSFLSSDELAEERPVGGRGFLEQDVDEVGDLVYLARLANGFDAAADVHADLGFSFLFGPNATGKDANTYILGADFALDVPLGNERFVAWQNEFLYRNFDAAGDPDAGIASDTLEDYGLYTQLTYGFAPSWSAGLRYGFATGDGESVGEFSGREADPFRDDRHRISPLLTWSFAPGARARLQYNYDNAEFLDENDAHTVWLGLEWAFGAGAAIHLERPGTVHHHH